MVQMTAGGARANAKSAGLAGAGALLLAIAVVMMIVSAPAHARHSVRSPGQMSQEIAAAVQVPR